MKIDRELKEKIIKLIKDQWKLFLCGGVIFLVVIIAIIILISGQNQKKVVPGNTSASSNDPSKKPFNLFGMFSNNDDEKKTDNTKQGTSFPTPHIGVKVVSDKFTITSITQGGNQSTKTVTGNTTIRTTQGTVSTNTNIQTDVNSNDQVDNIRIVFQNPDGSTTIYVPPGTPEDEVRWGRYTNEKGNYAINFPSNWQLVHSIDANGNEGIALYPPNTNPNDHNTPFIGFGITNEFRLPAAGDTSNAYATSLMVDGVSGSLYTNGPIGNSYIASVLQYNSKHFGLGSSMSSPTFAYVYYYMLNSLTLNNQ